ncbi:MAG: C10 family peptidase [Muribaculaceae bacterium]|nr:C10 family peptidase [Muribaculaceae bacterium]
MRGKITLSLLLPALLAANARQVTSREAEAAADDFFKSAGVNYKPTLRSVKVKNKETRDNNQPFYIYNAGDNNGFVIISGDDRSEKVLGYSDKGALDASNLPPQLQYLLDNYSEKLETANAGKPSHSSWKSGATRADKQGVLLETANWGQGYPYNAECPEIGGVQCPTGCVATAMAIMMKYHNWPESYDWASMPKNTEADPIDYEKPYASLAKLMRDAGEAVYMSYGPDESGAQMPWVGHSLQNPFRYSADCQFIYTRKHSEEENLSLLRGSLDKGLPVIYSGSGSGSHAFIIDGYNNDSYHVNWGWDGSCNGYFNLNALQPTEGSDFSADTGMVINIIPDKEGNELSECCIDFNLWANADVAEPMNISVEEVKKDEPFHILPGAVLTPANFAGEIGIALVAANNKIKEVLSSERVNTLPEAAGRDFQFLSVKVSSSDIDPTDRLQVVAKNDNDGYYKLVGGTIESPSYIGVTGNKPRWGKVKINVGEGTIFHCNIRGMEDDAVEGLGFIPTGKKEVNLLKGLSLSYYCEVMNPDPMKAVVFKADGPLIYGNMIMADKTGINYSIDIAGEHELQAYVVTLHDEKFNVVKAGTLKDLISSSDANGVRDLVISGNMNMDDFMYIRDNMPCVRVLDMKDVTIEACTATDELYVKQPSEYFADQMPPFGLVNLHSEYIEHIVLPENLKSIGSDSMVHFKVEGITIPAGVTSIGLNAFYANHYLKAVELLNPEPVAINDCVFVDTKCPKNGTLYVPAGSASKFRATPVWQDFKEIIEGPMPDFFHSSVEEIAAEGAELVDVYSISGTSVLRSASRDDLQNLVPGIYIVKDGKKTTKIAVK